MQHSMMFIYLPVVFLQVKMVLENLYENKKIASATHNIYAYRSVMSHWGPEPLSGTTCLSVKAL